MASTISETLIGFASFRVLTTNVTNAPLLADASLNVNLATGAALNLVSVRLGAPLLTDSNVPVVPAYNPNAANEADPWRLAFVNGTLENPNYKIVTTFHGGLVALSGVNALVTRQGDTTWLLNIRDVVGAAAVPVAAADEYSVTVSIYTVSLNC